MFVKIVILLFMFILFIATLPGLSNQNRYKAQERKHE